MIGRLKGIIGGLLLVALLPLGARATPLDFYGGVHNEYTYEEWVFISGEPLKFSGSYDYKERKRSDKETNISYRFKLTSQDLDQGQEARLDRTIRLTVHHSPYVEIGQTKDQVELTSYKETIRIGEDRYELEDYQLSKSDLVDNRPAADFYEGNITARRHYSINRDEGQVLVDLVGSNLGYENFWGATGTLELDNYIEVDRKRTKDKEDPRRDKWSGSYSFKNSHSLTRSLQYSENDSNLSSIRGGHMRLTEESSLATYDYDLGQGKRGRKTLRQNMVPRVERLLVPKFRDLEGHWAQEDIGKLYSLAVFDDKRATVFGPDLPMTRLDFTKAVVRACDMRPEEEEKKKSRKKEPLEEYFADIGLDHVDYAYVKSAVDKEIIEGIDYRFFGPDKFLTRAQALTILIRGLGYESKAPNPGYYTDFLDDGDLPAWARDSAYMASKIGLVKGDSLGRLLPNEYLTRAEASALLVNYLGFLEKDLQRDYRENIMIFN